MAGRSAPEPSGVCGMSDVRPDADHVEIERAKGENVFGQALKRLAGNADHDAAARFVAEALELPQQRQAIGRAGKALGMNGAKQILVRGLEAQQIAVGACFAPQLAVRLGCARPG